MERSTLIALRLTAHGLAARGRLADCAALDAGVQDTPPGTAAHLALAARVEDPPDPDQYGTSRTLALVHSARAAMHLHRTRDLGRLAAALRPDDATDLAVPTHGPFFRTLPMPIGDAIDEVADRMREAMSDGQPRTKGELSTELRRTVDERLRPWCSGCKVHHVHDGLFRMATLPAGLRLEPMGRSTARFLPPRAAKLPSVATDRARRELLRALLRLAVVAEPGLLTGWLGLDKTATKQWWSLVEGELTEVSVGGKRRWTLAADRSVEPARGVDLLPAYDPWLEWCDREIVVPDAARRREIWRPSNNPGVVLVDGEIEGVWRRRTKVVTVRPFGKLTAARRDAIAALADNVTFE
jgi:hypothetical protein